VSVGTTIAEKRRCGLGASGSVSQNTVVNAALLAPVVNHLCAETTHSSPSSRADDSISVGSEPATSGSVSPTEGKISPCTMGSSQRRFCASVP
jgi:hypothetical protein